MVACLPVFHLADVALATLRSRHGLDLADGQRGNSPPSFALHSDFRKIDCGVGNIRTGSSVYLGHLQAGIHMFTPPRSAPFKRSVTRIALAAALIGASMAATAAGSAGQTDSEKFVAENEAAMTKMMDGMSAAPTGDVDRDFVAMMIPHHQGAIEMAMSELRYGKNEQLRRIAQEIIVDQLQEIAAMRIALGQPVPPSAPAPTQPAAPSAVSGTAIHNHSHMH